MRNLKTGRLESRETFFHGGSRRYEFAGKEVKVTLPGGRLSTHRLTTVAHPQLLDAICAFVPSGRDSQEVLYISQAESFGTQGFVMTREGRDRVTTPAGTFECFKVKLTLDSRIGALSICLPARQRVQEAQSSNYADGLLRLVELKQLRVVTSPVKDYAWPRNPGDA